MLCFAVQELPASVRINEFMASNGETIFDEDDEANDWIELYNAGTQPIDLAGHGLSDDAGNRMRWIFPEITLPAQQFLLVWASGKDRRVPGEPLHTNFSISSSGEPLFLSNADGQTVDHIAAVALPRDVSYGRIAGETSVWAFFEEPTPGAANTTAPAFEWLEAPVFSVSAGFYPEAFDLTVTTTDPEATILYTIDGSEPLPDAVGGVTYPYKNRYAREPHHSFGPLLENSMATHVYDGPVRVRDRSRDPNVLSLYSTTSLPTAVGGHMPTTTVYKGTVVRARAVKPGAIASRIVTHSYFITPLGDARYPLPVVSVSVPEASLFSYETGIMVAGMLHDQWREANPTSTLAPWRQPANYYGRGREWERRAHLELFVPGEGRVLSRDLGVRTHGGGSRAWEQKSLRLYARTEYSGDNTMEYPFFGNHFDIEGNPIHSFRRLILRNSGNDGARSRFRDAMMQELVRPLVGTIQGFYPVVHFINGEYWGLLNVRDRIDQYYIASRYLVDPDDVAIVTYALDDTEYSLNTGNDADLDDFNDMLDFATGHDLRDPANFAFVADRMDIDEYILYCIAEIYVGNNDWPHNNIKIWRKRTPDRTPGAYHAHDGRWRWILFDLDNGFGLNTNVNHRTLAWALRTESWGEAPHRVEATALLRSLIVNDSFRHRFINALFDHLYSSFAPARAEAIIDEMHAKVGPARDEHALRWRNLGSDQVSIMKNYARDRPAVIRQQFIDYFNLPRAVSVRFDVSDPAAGCLQVNSHRIDRNTPGLSSPETPFPYFGGYFPTVPIVVRAIPFEGFRFKAWAEFPGHDSPEITVDPESGRSLTAVFEEAPPRRLLAYWNFNDARSLLTPTLLRTGTGIVINTGPGGEATDGGGNGFNAANARGGDPAGRHLRINSPLGTTILLSLPTTDLTDPVLTYETRRSGQGAGIQVVEYTLDGTNFEVFAKRPVPDDQPVRLRFPLGRIPHAENNPYFALKISFLEGDGGSAGNNRIDNLTFEGIPMRFGLAPSHRRYADWRWDAFPDPDERADPVVSGPKADPGGTGIPNRLRYALDIGPETTDSDRMPRVHYHDGGWIFRTPVDLEKTDIIYAVYASDDLRSWKPIYESTSKETDLTDGSFIHPLLISPVTGSTPFLRLIVLPAEP